MRHILPIRESGPLPAYDGPYTMEDIRNIYDKTCIGKDYHPCSHLPEEIMRRVPGLTRKEAEHITRFVLKKTFLRIYNKSFCWHFFSRPKITNFCEFL